MSSNFLVSPLDGAKRSLDSSLVLEDPEANISSGGLSKRLTSDFGFLLLVGALENESSSTEVVFGAVDLGAGLGGCENTSSSPNRSAPLFSFFFEDLVGGEGPNKSSSNVTVTLLGARFELKAPTSSDISFSSLSVKLEDLADFSEKLSSKSASRDEMDAVSWSFPVAVGGGGDWTGLEPEPALRRVRLEGGLLPAAR